MSLRLLYLLSPRKFDGKRELTALRAPVNKKRKLAELSCDALSCAVAAAAAAAAEPFMPELALMLMLG